MNKKLHLIVNILVSIVVLWLLFTKFNFSEILSNILMAKLSWLVLAVVVAFISRLVISPFIWRKILLYSGINVNYSDLFKINAVSLPLKFLLPFKITELVRAAGLKIFAGKDFSVGLSSTVLLKVMAIISALQVFILSCILKDKFVFALIAMLVMFGIVILMFIFTSYSEEIGYDWIKNIAYCFNYIPKNKFLYIYILSLILQSCEIVSAWLILNSLYIKIDFVSLIYTTSLMTLITSVPVSIQGLGLREMVSVFSLSDISGHLAFGFGFLHSVVYHIVPAVIGSVIWLSDFMTRIFSKSIVVDIFINEVTTK